MLPWKISKFLKWTVFIKMNLRLMSHNVWGMYAPDVVKRVDNRSDLMWEIYSEYHPDVIGMQEFSEDIRSSGLLENMQERYIELDVSEDIQKYGMENLFTPIFYHQETCEPLEKGFVLFDRVYNNHDSKGIAWAVFRHKPSGKIFSVANTHYWWKSGEEHDEARVKNSEVLLSMAQALPKPFFAMGDLNCTVRSAAYQKLSENGLCDVQLTAPITTAGNTHHPYPFHDSKTNTFYGAPAPEGNYTKAIDHMFLDGEHTCGLQRFEILTEERALNTSDHCPVCLDYSISVEK